jgi:hypothetical protein
LKNAKNGNALTAQKIKEKHRKTPKKLRFSPVFEIGKLPVSRPEIGLHINSKQMDKKQ